MNKHNKAHRLRMATDICALRYQDGKLQILLIRRSKEPFKGFWALPGGRLEADESLDQCAVRELQEETGLYSKDIRHFATFSDPLRDPRERTISACYITWIDDDAKVKAGSDAVMASWFSTSSLPDLAFDHKKIIGTCLLTSQQLISRASNQKNSINNIHLS